MHMWEQIWKLKRLAAEKDEEMESETGVDFVPAGLIEGSHMDLGNVETADEATKSLDFHISRTRFHQLMFRRGRLDCGDWRPGGRGKPEVTPTDEIKRMNMRQFRDGTMKGMASKSVRESGGDCTFGI